MSRELIQKFHNDNCDPYEDASFRGNENLVPKGHDLYVPQELFEMYVREIVRCKQDPIYFVNNYFYIISPAKGKHIIDTYPKQDELLKTFIENDRVCTLASRQVGKTVCFCMYVVWTCCFNQDKSILILANKLSTALEIMSRIRLAFELLPKWLKPAVTEWNKGKIQFKNGCKVEGLATAGDAARSRSCNILIIDEAAFINNAIMDDLWASVYPIISSAKDSKCILVSTPNGTGNMYYDIYNRGLRNQQEDDSGDKWVPFRIDWWEVPGRDEAWKAKQIESFNGDMTKWNQEFGNQFLGSSYTLINSEVIVEQKSRKINDHKTITFADEFKVKVWHDPIPGHCYTIGVDVSDGIGKDSTVIDVWDITHPTDKVIQVAQLSSKAVGPTGAAYVASKLGVMYNFAPLMIERNNMGNSAVDFTFQVYEYEELTSIGSKHLGILSNNKIKSKAAFSFRKFINMGCEINSMGLLNELEYFERKPTGTGHTYQCPRGKHDDHVMAAIWALYIISNDIIEINGGGGNFFEVEYETIGIEELPKTLRHSDLSLGRESQVQLDRIENKRAQFVQNSTGGTEEYHGLSDEDMEVNDFGFMNV